MRPTKYGNFILSVTDVSATTEYLEKNNTGIA